MLYIFDYSFNNFRVLIYNVGSKIYI